MAIVELIYDVKPLTYIAANPTKVLSNGEPIYYTNGQYSIGDGTTQLSSLPLYGGTGYTFTGTTSQYTRGDGTYATFPTNVSSFTNDSGYITSSALSPYLTSATAASTYLTIANAASTYQPIGSYLTGLTVGSTAIGSGTNTRILYNNAGVLGEYAVTGTGTTAVLSTSPTFTTDITTPSVIGGTANGSFITYKSTTGAGTSSNLAHSFIGGTNGGTTLFNLYNDGQVITGGGTIRNPTTFGNFRIAQSTSLIDMGFIAANQAAIWIQKTTPSSTNYTITADAATTIFNGVDSLIFSTGGTERFRVNRAQTSGSLSTFTWSSASNTGQTASTNIPGFLFTTGSRQWATGAITAQEEIRITSPTYSFVGASTITNAYTLFVNSPTAGTNATITNNYAAGFGGNVICTGFFRSGTYIYAENDFRIAGAVVLDYSSTTLQVATSSFFQSLSLRTNGVTRLALSTTDLTFSDSYNLIFNATTGTKIGTATTQKLAFWNATPIVQPTTAVAAATFVANTSAIANDTATFDGYTIGQIVKALRNAGLLA